MTIARAVTALALLLVVAACRPAADPASTPTPGGVDGDGYGEIAPPTPYGPTKEYRAIVVSESVDEITRIVFGPNGARVEHVAPVGMSIIDPDGPHGVALSPDGRHYFVSTAHGLPGGILWKYDAASNQPVGRVTLGPFPATVQVSPDGYFAWVVNFNLHGEMVPSSVSVVETGEMVEVARITTCTMPHGSRLSPDGRRHYSACMMDDLAVEIDATDFRVARHFVLKAGGEHGMAGAPGAHAGHAMGGSAMNPDDVSCSPTWAQPSHDGSRLWVACNKSSELVEIDVARWALVRRIPAGPGVYNLAVTSDGKYVVATNKRGQSVSVFDARSGEELARVPTSRRVVHGAAVTADNRYAFISNEGVGSEKATVDVLDLGIMKIVATVEVGQQAGGVDVER